VFTPLNEVERSLIAAVEDPTKQGAFARALLEGELIACPTSMPEDESAGIPELHGVTIAHEVAAAVFTAPERVVQTLGPDAPTVTFKALELLEWLRPGPVVLNPGQDYTVIWSAEELDALIALVLAGETVGQTGIRLGIPAQKPVALIRRLSAALGGEATVAEAYLMLAKREDRAGERLLLGVASNGAWSRVEALVGEAVRGSPADNRPLDLMPLDDSWVARTLKSGIPIVAPRVRRVRFSIPKG